MDVQSGPDAVEQAAQSFAAEVAYWRDVRGLSKRALARAMGFDPSYVSHIESGRHQPTEDFARRAEAALNAGKAIWRRWLDYDGARHRSRPQSVPASWRAAEQSASSGSALVVEHDEALLRFDQDHYRLVMRRRLRNTGSEPITRYLVRISVDRYPGEPERSNALYRAHPLTWDELNLTASCQGEPMCWQAQHDRDAFKEVWLRFANDDGRFPLYPQESTWIEYAYSVGADKWGPWFQRAVRLPTRHLAVRLDFPQPLDPAVWGTETSMTAEAAPLRTAPAGRTHDGRSIFDWSTDDPPLHARFRLEWRFRALRPPHSTKEAR